MSRELKVKFERIEDINKMSEEQTETYLIELRELIAEVKEEIGYVQMIKGE